MGATTGAINTPGGSGGSGGGGGASGGDPQGTTPRERVDVNVNGTNHNHPINLSNAPPLLSFPDSPWCGSAGTYLTTSS